MYLMMHNNRSQYYTGYRQRYIAEYSKVARTYREKIVIKLMSIKETLGEETQNYPDFTMKMNI